MNCNCEICENIRRLHDLLKRVEKLNDRAFIEGIFNNWLSASFEVECLQRAIENYKTRISDMKVVHHDK